MNLTNFFYFIFIFFFHLSCAVRFYDTSTLSSSNEIEKSVCVKYAQALHYYTIGKGTEEDPYLICTADQLIHLSTATQGWDKYFILMQDVDFTTFGQNVLSPIGNSTTQFTGSFDGNFKTISGLNYNSPTTDNVGFIGYLGYAGVVKNLGLPQITLIANENGGAIAGTNKGLIMNSYASGSIQGLDYVGGITGKNDGFLQGVFFKDGDVYASNGIVGGIAGESYGSGIIYSYSNATVEGDDWGLGGIVGSTYGSIIYNSYFTGSVVSTGGGAVGGIAGYCEDTKVLNSFTTGSVDGGPNEWNVGLFAGDPQNSCFNSVSSNYVLSTASFTGCGGDCNLGNFSSHASISDFYSSTNAPMNQWPLVDSILNGNTNKIWKTFASDFPKLWFEFSNNDSIPFNGSGTRSDPYRISSVEEFFNMNSNPRWMDAYFQLDNDLDFSGQTMVQIGETLKGYAFTGQFDGNQNKFSNISIINPSNQNVGVFDLVIGTIKKLTIENSTFQSLTTAASLADSVYGNIENTAAINVSVNAVTSNAGLVKKFDNGQMINSYTTGSVTGTGSSGGLAVYAGQNTEISYSYSTATVNGTGAGGFIYEASSSEINHSYATGNVTSTSIYAGGFIAKVGATQISDCYATGNVSGTGNYVGGLIGYGSTNGATITDSYATGTVNGTGSYVGGLIGDGRCVSNSYATGNVTGGGTSTGGLMGKATLSSCDVSDSYATGNVTGSNTYVGGLIGYLYGNSLSYGVKNSYATGNVNGSNTYVGGLIGRATNVSTGPLISESYAKGTVTGTNNYNGGLIGVNNGKISNSYATGNVTGLQYTGGLVGYNTDTGNIEYSYATGNINGRRYSGALCGANSIGTASVIYSFATGNVNGNNNLNISRILGTNTTTSTGNYTYSGSTFVGCSGSCNLDTQSSHGALSSFYDSGNAPFLGNWDFTTKWIEKDSNNDGTPDGYPLLINTPE